MTIYYIDWMLHPVKPLTVCMISQQHASYCAYWSFRKACRNWKPRRQTFPGNKQFKSSNSKQETREYRNLLIHHKMANIQIPEVTRLKIYSNSVVVISINPYLLGMMSTQVVVESMLPTWRSGTPSQQRGWRLKGNVWTCCKIICKLVDEM